MRCNVIVHNVIRIIVMQYTVIHYNAIVLDAIRPIVIQYNVIRPMRDAILRYTSYGDAI